jgi:hypothetical protein
MKTFLILPLMILSLSFSLISNAQSCIITCPENIVAKADSGKGGTYVNFPAATVSGNCTALTYTPASGSFFQLGSTSVIVTTVSGERCSFTVTVTDNEPPVLSPIVLSAKRLWPANGRMRDIAVRYIVSDNAPETNCVITVASNDSASNGSDYEVVDPHLVRLKALRLSNGMARTYIITVSCTDAAGNTAKRSTGITVAKNVSPKKVKD